MARTTKRSNQKQAACHSEAERKALGVDATIKEGNLARLKRIEGQVRGIARMVEDDRYCLDILNQIVAAQEAMRGVSRELIRNHLSHCVPAMVKRGESDGMANELAEIFQKLTK